MTEKAGANLRNELAHGLIEPGTQEDSYVHLWWMFLRFVVAPFAAAIREAERAAETSAKPKRVTRETKSAAKPKPALRGTRGRRSDPTTATQKRTTAKRRKKSATAEPATSKKTTSKAVKKA